MIKFYDFLLTLLKPLIILIGKIGLPKRKFTGADYFKYRDKINVGGIFLTKTNYELSNLVNPCDIKHGAIYVGDVNGDGIRYVLESVGKGVVLTDLVTFLTTKDRVIYVEYKYAIKTSFNNANKFIALVLGTKYDYLFNPDGKAFYCFELCADFIKEFFPHSKEKLKFKEVVKDKLIYDHDTFLDTDLFTVIFDNRGN